MIQIAIVVIPGEALNTVCVPATAEYPVPASGCLKRGIWPREMCRKLLKERVSRYVVYIQQRALSKCVRSGARRLRLCLVGF